MRKFLNLVWNEYIKILCKTSTKIMLIVIILVAFGFNGILYLNHNFGGRGYSREWTAEQYIQNAQNNPYPGSDIDVEQYTYFRDNNISVTADANDVEAWRTNAVYALFDLKSSLESASGGAQSAAGTDVLNNWINELDAIIKNDDWKAYYAFMAANDIAQSATFSIDQWMYNYLLDNNIAPGDWRNSVVTEMYGYKQTLLSLGGNLTSADAATAAENANDGLAVCQYRLDNNLRYYTYSGIESATSGDSSSNDYYNFWSMFAKSVSIIGILSVLIIIIAGGILSGEFSAGTVKFLLINPVKRWKIFTAKYITILTVTLVMLVTMYVFDALAAGLFFGFGGFLAPYLSASGGTVIVGSSFLYVAAKYLLSAVGIACLATFAFAVSSLVRSSQLAIGLSIFLYFAGSIVVTVLNQVFHLYQAKFILFANTDLSAVVNGTTGFVNHTLTFALVNIAVYMIVFLLTAYDAFVRNDVK